MLVAAAEVTSQVAFVCGFEWWNWGRGKVELGMAGEWLDVFSTVFVFLVVVSGRFENHGLRKDKAGLEKVCS